MNQYELMVILEPDLDSQALDRILDNLGSIVSSNDGEVAEVDKWGQRRLAYEIDGKTEGQYVVVTFKSEEDVPREIQRVLNLNESVLRHMILRTDEE